MSESEKRGMLLCIPGPWKDRSEFVRALVSETKGEFLFAGLVLMDVQKKDHVRLDFESHNPEMAEAFEIASQGKLPPEVLNEIVEHRGAAYLHFPVEIVPGRERVVRFTDALRRCSGYAVKIESAGVAHEWGTWFSALESNELFDFYRTFVVLIGDSDFYYSCGMHHFGLPEVEVGRAMDAAEAAEVMNGFNFWQMAEEPKLESGHTFSLTADGPKYRLTLKEDSRHDDTDFFHNPDGLWNLKELN